MNTTKQGFLLKNDSDSWSFHPGHSLKEKSLRNNNPKAILLPDFDTLAKSLHASKHIWYRDGSTSKHSLKISKIRKLNSS